MLFRALFYGDWVTPTESGGLWQQHLVLLRETISTTNKPQRVHVPCRLIVQLTYDWLPIHPTRALRGLLDYKV